MKKILGFAAAVLLFGMQNAYAVPMLKLTLTQASGTAGQCASLGGTTLGAGVCGFSTTGGIISVIGSDLRVAGLTKTAVVALTDGGVEILGLHQLMRNVDVQFVIQEDDFERAITLLHAQLIEKADVRDGARTIGRQAA